MPVFCDSKGMIHVDCLEKGITIKGAYYAKLLKRVCAAINDKRRDLLARDPEHQFIPPETNRAEVNLQRPNSESIGSIVESDPDLNLYNFLQPGRVESITIKASDGVHNIGPLKIILVPFALLKPLLFKTNISSLSVTEVPSMYIALSRNRVHQMHLAFHLSFTTLEDCMVNFSVSGLNFHKIQVMPISDRGTWHDLGENAKCQAFGENRDGGVIMDLRCDIGGLNIFDWQKYHVEFRAWVLDAYVIMQADTEIGGMP
ncbi:hypothetical protein CAPTEDRAFT_202884 [Capitella teleta]|uniref:Uncharacterized protein n=1 Tax=Capitella teleta TaxID=283909 RepID=R7UY27_CAPTE|nr:hypothetical protein CAPTEDRAFT_202884 [Capitella teleta]|eukprot:ELU11194.1 hypothetical protein CAPTEDRAFT_202884 [Capitella teleta]